MIYMRSSSKYLRLVTSCSIEQAVEEFASLKRQQKLNEKGKKPSIGTHLCNLQAQAMGSNIFLWV